MNPKPIYISQTDSRLIRHRLPLFLESKRSRDNAVLLLAELERAVIVADDTLSDDIISLGSTIVIADHETGEQERYTLTLPEQADIAQNRLSVFSPLGTALLGYAAGDTISWKMPGGIRRYRVVEIIRATAPAHA